MSTLVTVIHVVVCLFLMLTVLLQQGKGGMGGAFGGSNAGSVFGGGGASGFLRKLTAIAATVFMLTSMTLAFLATRDAGDALEKISKGEAAKKRREKESQRKLLEAAGDAGVMLLDLNAGDGGMPTPGEPTLGVDPAAPPVPAPGTGPAMSPPAEEPELPTDLVPPAAGSAAPAAGSAAPAAGSAAGSPAPAAGPAAPAAPVTP